MKIRKGSFRLSNGVYFKSGYTIVGKKEEDGNFSGNFDLVLKNDLWGEKSYEKAECKMLSYAISKAIENAGMTENDIISIGNCITLFPSVPYSKFGFGFAPTPIFPEILSYVWS